METTDQNEEDTQHTSSQKDEEDDSSKLKKRPATALTLVCGVCSAPAPDHLHFGAHSCYSCRAFFRRTTQRNLVKGLKRCRTGLNKCEISNKTKSCIHCRYLKCIEIGMTPDLMKGYRKKEDTEKTEENENETDIDGDIKDSEDQERTVECVFDNKGDFLYEGVGKQEQTTKRQCYPPNKEKEKSTSQGLEHSFQSYDYSKQEKRLENSVKRSFIQGFSFPTYSGNQRPTSTVTSQVYNREQEQESSNKNKSAEDNAPTMIQHIKIGTRIFDDILFERSMTSDKAINNPYPKKEENQQFQNVNLHEYKSQENQHHNAKSQCLSRPSVIRNLYSEREQDQRFLKLESDMLKLHGNLLKQTGSIFNFHANILDQHRMLEEENLPEPLNYKMSKDCVEVHPKQEMKEKKGSTLSSMNEKQHLLSYNESINKIDETEDLMENTPWRLAMDRYLKKSSAGNLDALVENVLLDTLVEVEAGNAKEKEENQVTINYNSETFTDPLFTNEDDSIAPRTTGQVSVIQGPEMVFTVEELNFLEKNKIIQEGHLRSTCPVSLYQARVGLFLGTLSMEGMLMVFAAGRKSQNYYHYMTMSSQPFFCELTTRTQSLLMRHNTQLCFALNISNYFFGHNAKTAIEQEEMTGLVTGLGDYIRANAPVAVNMPLAAYDEYFAGPWGTDRELEAKHRELTKSIGESIRDLNFSAYLLLYGVTLYNINQEAMNEMEIQQKDVEIIKKAQNYLDILYKRYTKHLVGWKKASETRLNQRYLLDQMNECVLIFSMINCHLNDLTDCNTLDVSTVKLQ
eukprot:GFUD01013946.1.p1 GENE.GFUD01013946.1~~GFUD01013946.1.p1  ORF type:complete len:796 (+),score=184.42 GFUD01013946.1:66-2453(+)